MIYLNFEKKYVFEAEKKIFKINKLIHFTKFGNDLKYYEVIRRSLIQICTCTYNTNIFFKG